MKQKNTFEGKAFLELYLKLKDIHYLLSYRVFLGVFMMFIVAVGSGMSVQMRVFVAGACVYTLCMPLYGAVIRCRSAALRWREEYDTSEETGTVCFTPENAVVTMPARKCEVTVDYQNVVNFYKLRHYYFLLIVTEETIPVFMERQAMSEEQEEKLNTFIMQKVPHLQYQSIKTIKENFDFYQLSLEGDLYGI